MTLLSWKAQLQKTSSSTRNLPSPNLQGMIPFSSSQGCYRCSKNAWVSETVEMLTIVTTLIAGYWQGTIVNRSMIAASQIVAFITARLLKSSF